MINNIIIKYILFIRNNLFQLNMIYIFPPNNNPIFYGTPITLLNNQENLINTSSNTNPKQIIISNIFKNKDNSLTK